LQIKHLLCTIYHFITFRPFSFIGSPYLGNLENDIGFGYCGKVYDVGTGLYDYGFRDYSPVSGRTANL
ncbi:MAG: hypothetical protein J6U06_03250, partial [Spirochaetaceae bacterium]|nr:hypothetical protein [Spirochaetaceae bacterium]